MLDFRKDETESTVKVSSAPDMGSVSAGLAARINYDPITGNLNYRGRMNDAHYNELQGMFSDAGDLVMVTVLRDRTRSTSRIPNNNGTLIVREDVTMEELQLYILNMDNGGDYLSGLGFLKTWADTETGNTYTLEPI